MLIGDNVTISANVFITNLDHEYSDIFRSVMEQGHIIQDTTIGDGSFIGYGATILAGSQIGKHCVIGANSVVRGIFEDYSVIVGVPARVVKRYNFKYRKWEKVKS